MHCDEHFGQERDKLEVGTHEQLYSEEGLAV